ncbi:hypothetical protein GGI11_006605, partial [Coemansia sp. RSA 2049]
LRTILFYRDGKCIAYDLWENGKDIRDDDGWFKYYKVLLGDEKNRHVLDWGETHEDRAKQNVAKAKLEAKAKAEAEAAEAEAAAASENTAESTIAQAACEERDGVVVEANNTRHKGKTAVPFAIVSSSAVDDPFSLPSSEKHPLVATTSASVSATTQPITQLSALIGETSEIVRHKPVGGARALIVQSKLYAISSEILRLQYILSAASGTAAPLGTNLCETLDRLIQDLIDNYIKPLVNEEDEYASHLYSKLLAMKRLSKAISRQASERRSNLPSTSYITDRMGSLQADSGPSCTSVTSSKRSFGDLEYTDGDIAAAEAQTPTKRPNTRSRSRGNTNARRK